MQLVYCQHCRNPIAKVAPGSRVEIKCKTCGHKTMIETESAVMPAPRVPMR
jgi:phage FluMu protein Com